VPRHTCITFDQEGIWDDDIQNGEAKSPAPTERDPTLHELILRTRHNHNLEILELTAQEKRIIELLVANSLFNLDTSHWIRTGLDIDKISVRVVKTASDLLARWKPHIACSLPTSDDEDDENAAVLSFGLLLMEMEADRAAEVKEEDKDWDNGGVSRDSILKRILGEWADNVEDDYKDIATACLLFRQLSEKFYDPQLRQDTKRTGAIYKYILAPLFRVVAGKFRKTRELFPGVPQSVWNRSVLNDHILGRHTSAPDLTLFDGCEVAKHTPQ
jgi:hypothetical protein